jgi:hypothetical protein
LFINQPGGPGHLNGRGEGVRGWGCRSDSTGTKLSRKGERANKLSGTWAKDKTEEKAGGGFKKVRIKVNENIGQLLGWT